MGPEADALLLEALTDDPAPSDHHEQVLDGALTAFLDFGIRRTSMNEIARRSGVSPASLYRWYGTKDALVAAVGLREVRRFLADLESQVGDAAPAEEQLAEMTVQVARRLRDQPLLRRLIETEPESILPRLTTDGAPIIEAGTAYLRWRIERLIDQGVIGRFDARPLAEMLARVTHSMILTPPPGGIPDDEALRAAARDAVGWLRHLPARRPA